MYSNDNSFYYNKWLFCVHKTKEVRAKFGSVSRLNVLFIVMRVLKIATIFNVLLEASKVVF